MAWSALGWSGVGPGVRRRCFLMCMELKLQNSKGRPRSNAKIRRGSTRGRWSVRRSAGVLWLLALAGAPGAAGGRRAAPSIALLVAHRDARLELVHAVGD